MPNRTASTNLLAPDQTRTRSAAGSDAAELPPLRQADGRLGIAVSGGGDSVALLQLLAALPGAPELHVYTVDHGLRPEAATEARWVQDLCRGFGLPHRTLGWVWDGRGNLAEAARLGRYSALAAACHQDGVGDCALAHTADDNLETFFLGLMRGAGLDGLAGMRRAFRMDGVLFHRPLLDVSRAELRDVLRQCGASWHEDPGNADLRRDRARIRHMLSGLDLPARQTAQSLAALAATRRDLGTELLARLDGAVTGRGPDLAIDLDRFRALTPEFRRRSLSAALLVVGRQLHPARAGQLMRLVRRDWSAAPGPVTLHGCRIMARRGLLLIGREAAALPPPAPAASGWDGWRIEPAPAAPGNAAPDAVARDLPPGAGDGCALMLGPLGAEGLAQLDPGWRQARIPRASMLASAGLWHGSRLVAAAFGRPRAAPGGAQSAPEWRFARNDLPEAFISAIMAH